MLGGSSSIFDNYIKSLVQISGSKNVLELGCGQGKFGELMKERRDKLSLCAVKKYSLLKMCRA